MTISKLKQLAEDDLGCPVIDAVISVPAYFTNIQRQSVINAGVIAGVNVKQIVNEASVAAIHYDVEKPVCGRKSSNNNILKTINNICRCRCNVNSDLL